LYGEVLFSSTFCLTKWLTLFLMNCRWENGILNCFMWIGSSDFSLMSCSIDVVCPKSSLLSLKMSWKESTSDQYCLAVFWSEHEIFKFLRRCSCFSLKDSLLIVF